MTLFLGLSLLLLALFVGMLAQLFRNAPHPSAPAVAALEELARRLGGSLRWDSPYEVLVTGRARLGPVEVRAWLERDVPPPVDQAALSVVLLVDRPLALQGRTARVQREGLTGWTLGLGPQRACRSLLALGVDEVVVSAVRVEARVARVEDALQLLDVYTTEQMVERMRLLADAIGARPVPAPKVTATERTAQASPAASTCPYCRTPVDDDPEECPACATLHHGECLREHGRCTVHGCRGRPSPRVQERA